MLLVCLVFVSTSSWAQECMGVLLKEGSGYEMLSFDAKGKENGRMIYRVEKVSKVGETTLIEMNLKSFDKKGDPNMSTNYELKCTGNDMRVDASALLGEEQRKSLESFNMKFTSEDIVYPSNLSVGQTLPDGAMHGVGGTGGMAITTDMTLTNRKVVGKESLTVPAGSFDTYKVTSDMKVTSKSIVKVSFDFQIVSYRAANVLWDIKSETYRNGKLVGSTVLSKTL